MYNSKWIGIGAAHDGLIAAQPIGLRERNLLASEEMAWRVLIDDLIDGRLPSRPSDPNDYELLFTLGSRSNSVPLAEDGTLPRDFWFHFQAASDRQRNELPTICDDEAFCVDKNTYFKCTGLADGGTLIGRAGRVLVLQSALADLLPNSRGHPKGVGKFMEIDQPVVEDIVKALASETWKSIDQCIRQHIRKVDAYGQPGDHLSRLRIKVRHRRRELELK